MKITKTQVLLVIFIFTFFSCANGNQKVIWYKAISENNIEISESPENQEKDMWKKIVIGPWEISNSIKYRSSEDLSQYKVQYVVLWEPADVIRYIKEGESYNRYGKFLEPLFKSMVLETLLELENVFDKSDGDNSEQINQRFEQEFMKKLKSQKMKTMDQTVTEYFNVNVISIDVTIE